MSLYSNINEKTRFHNLTIIQPLENNNWLCECVCGNQIEANAEDLLSGKIRSCGCRLQKINRAWPQIQYTVDLDMIANNEIFPERQFGELTAVEKINRHYWKCNCSCGNEIIVNEAFLLNKITLSCGCKNKG